MARLCEPGRPAVPGIQRGGEAVVPGGPSQALQSQARTVQGEGRCQAVRLGGGPGGSGAGLAAREGGRPGGSGLISPPALPWRRGTFYQGYLCTKCGVGAHKECLEVTPPCKISEYRPRPTRGARAPGPAHP